MQKFTDQKFIEAVRILQATEGQKARSGKRRAPRQQIRVPVQIKFGVKDSKGAWITTELRDMSGRGVSLAVGEAMNVGSSLLLRLPAPAWEDADAPLICRVCYCRRDSAKVFLAGVEFVGRLDATPTSANSAAERERIQRSILG